VITPQEARRRILKKISRQTAVVPLASALGCVIAENSKAPFDMPLWNNSAMDGFAIRSCDVRDASPSRPVLLTITGTLRAGDAAQVSLRRAGAIRIMTGAPVPEGTDAVIPKEFVTVDQNSLSITSAVAAGSNIRSKGEDLKKGAPLDFHGSMATPGVLGFLASVGKARLKIYRKPSVSVITTGSELVPPGRGLRRGQIHDSNSVMLAAALEAMGITPSFVRRAPDRRAALSRLIHQGLQKSDVLILSGGVSVGDFDFVKEILLENGAKTAFWKIAQKPGKPLFFATCGKKLIFGLPGNPVSAYMCFYEYVFPALRACMGFGDAALPRVRRRCLHSIRPDRTKTKFVAAEFSGSAVRALRGQGSHMTSALAGIQAWIVVPPGIASIQKGAWVHCDLLPAAFDRNKK